MAIFDGCCTSTTHDDMATLKVDAALPSTAAQSGASSPMARTSSFRSFVKPHAPMPKNVLILNCGDEFMMAHGKLNAHLADKQFAWFASHGVAVKLVNIAAVDDKTTPQEHIANIQWADLVIFQFPIFWANVSKSLKNFFDVVYTTSYGTLVTGDGRSRKDPSKKYGSGGLCGGKHYMLSFTCNTPQEAYDDPAQFYRGQGVEFAMFHVHAPNMFLGMTPLPSFPIFELFKEGFDVAAEEARLTAHLKKIFSVHK